MTDKERLEEIKGRVWRERCAYAVGDDSSREGYRYILSDEDYHWLLEQAEKREYWMKQHRKRANELEDAYFKIQLIENQLNQAQAKVERYKQALEFYADEKTYETKFATDTDEIFDPFTLIELDEGKKARKALEGKENDG